MAKKISLAKLCKRAKFEMQLGKQWDVLVYPDEASKYVYRAEAIIEIVETADCGSIGGFSDGMERWNKRYTIEERISFLYDKYVKEKGNG